MFRAKKKFQQQTLRDLLHNPDRGVGKSSSIPTVLSTLFKELVLSMGMEPELWYTYIKDYALREAIHRNNPRDIASIRGNLNKEFLRKTMTWKVFVKAMMFLKVKRFRIIVIAQFENNKIVEVSHLVDVNTAYQEPKAFPVMEDIEKAEKKYLNPITIDYSAKEIAEQKPVIEQPKIKQVILDQVDTNRVISPIVIVNDGEAANDSDSESVKRTTGVYYG